MYFVPAVFIEFIFLLLIFVSFVGNKYLTFHVSDIHFEQVNVLFILFFFIKIHPVSKPADIISFMISSKNPT